MIQGASVLLFILVLQALRMHNRDQRMLLCVI